MAAFLDICTYLGAEEISVTYLGDNQTTIAGGIRVDGSFAQKYTPSIAVKAQAIRNDKNAVIANIKLAGSLAPHKIKTHWFSDEPLWHSMYIARINKGIKTFDMEFKYDNDYKVNANVAAAFSNGAYSIGVDMSGEYANFVSQYWRFQVKFRPGVFVSLGPAVEIH